MKKRTLFFMMILALETGNLWANIFSDAGHTFEIGEENFFEVIKRRLLRVQQTGQWEHIEESIKEKIKGGLLRPVPVGGVKVTRDERQFIYDPTITVKSDIRDHRGRLIYPKGATVNPLDTINWGNPLFIIQGDDPVQLNWALKKTGKIVLINGSPIQLMERYKRRFYFDQGGLIIKKLSIQQVPARIIQKGRFLFVEEIKVNP